MQTRRKFVKNAALTTAAIAAAPSVFSMDSRNSDELFFKISLAEWSLNKMIKAEKLDNLDFPEMAIKKFGIDAVEYVNQFFPSSGPKYAQMLKSRTDDLGVKNILIMIDGEGDLGEQMKPKRKRSVERHFEWIECAKALGCHSIRVNAGGEGSAEDIASAASDSLSELGTFAADHDINVIVENHGGYSSDGNWLSSIMKKVDMKNVGTLPDFGNFIIGPGNEYDRYQGMKDLMPFARGVSAKSHDFNEEGDEIHSDYYRMLKIVKEAGYGGYIGIEYEGRKLSETDGIIATKKLLIKAGKTL